MIQVRLTPAMGKRLIGKGMVAHPSIQRVLADGTLVIIAGSTNGYVAEEVLASLGQGAEFARVGFRRGLTVPPGAAAPEMAFPGDVVIRRGQMLEEGSIFKIKDELDQGDVVLKGGNAFDANGHAAVQIGSNVGGTALAAVSTVIGRRVELIIPIGLEKRVFGNIQELALLANDPAGDGPGYFPLPGRIFTELDAIKLLTGAEATMIAGGGVYGAEGGSWLIVNGSAEAIAKAGALIDSLIDEPLCQA
jgi:hypothetical protein